jgi:Chlorophyllase enzyme
MILSYSCLALLLMISAGEAAMAGVTTAEAGDCLHQIVGHHAIGTAGSRVWIFFPDAPRPASANVVLFLHGYRALDPAAYGGWIDHIAKKGNIVLYPLFEESRTDPPQNSLRNAIESTKQALRYLADLGPVKPDLSDFSIVGHSFGGGLAAQVAALAASSGLPEPRAVMSVEPGWLASKNFPTDSLTGIPPSTYLLVVEGDKDQFQDSRHGSTIFEATTQIPPDHKAFVRLKSTGGLIADHYAPLSPDPAYHLEEASVGTDLLKKVVKSIMGIRAGETDALDRQGLWPMFDELMSVAASGGTIDNAVKAATIEIEVGQ